MCLVVCVWDPGPGFNEAHRQRIFEDFYRINAKIEGAGLGLGIASRFSRLLGHEIRVVSREGHGSLFSVLLPLRRKGIATGVPAIGNTLSTGLEKLTLFYVDDDINNSKALGELVHNWGCQFVSVHDAAAAIAYTERHPPPDVLVIDYQLSVRVNGIDLARQLLRRWPDIPVCVVSGATDEDLPQKAAADGFDFLRKPIKPNKLRALLDGYLTG